MATGGPPEEFGGDQDLPNWGHESLDDRLNNLDWSGQKKANRSAEKNKKKFVIECDTRLTNDISPESSPGVGRRRTRTPHTFPHTRYVSQMSVPEQAELERLKQKINFGDMDQRSIGSDSQGRATAANNKRQPAENRKPFNFLPIQLNTNKDKESSPSPSKKESSAFSLPKDFLARDFTKDFLQNYSASLEEIGRGEPAIDSSQVVSRLVQIREYITKASTLRDDLVEKNERSANVERLSHLIDHLKAQEKSYLKFLQKMLARENEEEDVRTIDSAVGSGSVAESTSLNIDVLSEASGTTEISLSRPRIEGNLGSSASPMNVSSVDVPTSSKMKGDRRAEKGRDMCPARIWVEHHGLLSKAVDPQQEAKEELKNMKKQHALLTRMLQQQEQLRALKGRQAALLALQQKAEQAIAVMDESVVTETTGSVSGLSLTSELNEELNELIQRFHNQLHDSQTQPVPDNRRQAESLSLAREVSQSRNSSLSEPLSEDKGSIFSKLEVLLDKKKKMDSLLGELHTLQDHNLNNTAGSPQRSLDQRSTGSVASVPLTSDNRAANSPPAAAAAYLSDSVTPLNESEDEDNPDPAEKLKKLKEVRKRLNELRDLVHYYEQTSDMMTDAVNENTKDEEETEDSEYDSEQDVTHPITNIRNRHHLSSWAQMNSVTNAHSGTNNLDERQLNTECEINNRSAVNLRTFNMTSALECLYNRENGEKEDDCDLDHDDDEDAEHDQASRVSLSSRSSIAEDAQNADFEQKFSRLIAAKQKLKQLQDLVAMYGDDTESETVAADRAVNPDQHLAEVAKPKQQPNNTSLNASKIQKDIALKEQAREKFYESKLQQQQQELKQLQEERKKLIEIQEKIKTLQAACPDLQLSTSSTGAYPTNVQIPTTSSTPDVSISSKMAAAALPDPEDSSSVDNEVWSEIRRHQILREDLRQRRKQLESLMAEHQRRQGLTETISGTSVRSDDSDTHGLHQQSRTEKTMATWGGSTQCALDEEDDEEDCLSEANQVEEEEEEQDVTFNENVSYPHRMNQSALNGKASKSGWKDPRPFSVDGNYRPSPKSRQQQNISMRRQENLRWMSELSHVEEKEHWQDQINQLKKQLEFSTNICQTLMQDQQALSYLLQNLLTNPYSVMPSNVGSPQVHLLMHQLNQCYTQLTWQQNNVQRLKQMLNDLMREQQEHLQKDSQQRNERGNNVPPPSSPNAFTPFSFLPPSMNFFNMPTFPNLCNMAPGLNFNPLFQPGFRNFPNNITSQPDTLLQPQDHNISGKTEYMAFPKPFESNSSNATEQERNPPKPDDGERRKDMWSEDKPIDQVKKHTFFDDGPSASSNSLKQSVGTRRVKQFDEESLDSLSSMPDPGDPTTRTKTFKSRKGSAQACLASKDKTPKTKNKKRKIFHQKSKVVKTTGFCTVSASSVAEPKQSKSIHAQTEETATGNIHPTNSEHLDRMIKENRSVENSSEAGSDFAMFEALRDTIYSEVATLISQNESRPHFLIELFHELQLLNTDFLRQKALFSLQDIVTRRISENSQQKDGHKTVESAEWMASNSELTPSESLATTDDEIYEKNSDGPICREGEQNDGDNISNMSTSSNFEPFATDDLGNTVIHLDQALARMREYERMKIEAENNLDADSCNSPNSAATNLKDGPNREAAQAQLSGDDGPVVPCPRIDTQQLDRQIKAIMKEVIPFLKEHMEEVCTPYLLTSIRRMVLTLTQQNDESKEFVKFFHKQLGSILQDSLAKFSSRKLKDCGEDLLVEISEVLFNELAFFRLMQDLDNSSTVQGRCKRKSESDGALQSFSKEAQKMYEDEICSATTEVEDEDKDKDETETMKKVKETENCDPGVQSGRSDISDEEEEDASLPVSISLSKAETQALTNYGSGEDENEEEDNYEFEAGPVDVQTSLEANSEAADENEQILRETLGRTVVIERSELIAAHNTGEEHTVAQDPVSPSGVEAIPATLLLNKESESASSVTVDGKSQVASPASSGVGSPATESPVLVNEFETGSGNLSQKSDEDDFVKVEDLPLKLSMSETDPIKEMEKESENNNLCEEILNFTGEGNAAIELAGDPLLLKAPEMFGAHSA